MPPPFHPTHILLIALILTGITYFAFTQAASVASEDTMVLSNGKEVRLGQSLASLQSRTDLLKDSNELFVYPADPLKETEVLIHMSGGRVVIIQAAEKAGQRLKATATTIGQTKQQLKTKLKTRLKELDKPLSQASLKGAKVGQTLSNAFFLTKSCSSSEAVVSIALVAKGSEAKFTEINSINCSTVEVDPD